MCGALQNCYSAPETTERLCKLQANIAASDHDEVLGQPVQFKNIDVRHRLGFAQARSRRNSRMRAQIQKYPLAGNRSRSSIVEIHLKRLWASESGVAHHQFSAGLLVLFHVDRDQPVHHLAFTPPHRLHVYRDRSCDRAKLRAMANQIGDLRAPYLVLCWKTIDVWARAADPSAFDHHRVLARLRQMPGKVLS